MRLLGTFRQIDVRITRWMARHGIAYLRISLGAVFLWFGVLKFFPGMSPAEDLAADTIARMTFGLVAGRGAIVAVATLETLIGAGLLTGFGLRLTLLLLWLQMAGTVVPLFLFPERVFRVVPCAPTLEGQYILKNVVLVSAAIVIGATVRGGRLVADPPRAA
jgi:uncharacterized membrane protein YkgB